MKIFFTLSLVLATAAVSRAAADESGHPYPGITYHTETRQNPPMRLFVAEVDLKDPHIHVRVSPGGADPDGPGKWQTTLMQPTKVAEREHFDLVVNGDFFFAHNIKDAEGVKSAYRPDVWAAVEGAAVTDGKAWSQATNNRPSLVIHKDGKADFENISHPAADDWEVIAGNNMLVKNGKVVPHKSKTRNPRTAVGLDSTGTKLTILVVDGRKKGVSIGMGYEDLGKEMARLGCEQALNLDGGGSSVFALRDPATKQMRILNTPSDGHERAVADVLGISVEP